MKEIKSTGFTKIVAVDEKGQGGAYYEYRVVLPDMKPTEFHLDFARIGFQNGPIKEHGVNGCTQEDLLEIVKHRLESFQSGDFACIENAESLHHVNLALKYLNDRTKDRQDRNVEGLNKQ